MQISRYLGLSAFQKLNYTWNALGKSSSMGLAIFSTKWHGLHPLKWDLDLFTKWFHYKMTYKNLFCSGLKATHSVWEIAWGF